MSKRSQIFFVKIGFMLRKADFHIFNSVNINICYLYAKLNYFPVLVWNFFCLFFQFKGADHKLHPCHTFICMESAPSPKTLILDLCDKHPSFSAVSWLKSWKHPGNVHMCMFCFLHRSCCKQSRDIKSGQTNVIKFWIKTARRISTSLAASLAFLREVYMQQRVFISCSLAGPGAFSYNI